MTASDTAQQSSNMFGAMLLAATVGMVFGLLTAPAKGSETRTQLKQRMNDAKEKARTTTNKMSEKTNRMIESAKNKSNDTMDAAKDKVEEARSQVEDITAETQARQRTRRQGLNPA
jgi:gas vesicle protein